jgi:uncharacterized membrane protein YjjP (DUF1212 family)
MAATESSPGPSGSEHLLILELARALHEAGAPSHRVEDAMAAVAPRLGVEGQFFTTPTSIFASFGPVDAQRTAMLRVEPGSPNLARMSALDALIDQVRSGHLDARHGLRRLRAIARAPMPYGPALTVLCYGVSAMAVARFLGGGPPEVLASLAVGLQTGVLARIAARHAAAARVFEWLAPPAAALAALAWAWVMGPMTPALVAIAGVIVLVPGLTLTVALTELTTRNLVSGTARLAGAAVTFLAIGFGLALGARLEPVVGPAALRAPLEQLPPWTEWAALLLAPFALAVLFRARPRDVGVIFATGVLAFAVARTGARIAGAEVGMLVAAFALGAAGNLYARGLERPAAVPVVPGLLMLVPGSLGVRSVSTLLARDVISGVELAITLVTLAGALAAGLLIANLVVPPRRTL